MQHQGVIFPQAQLNSTMLLANSHGQCSNIVKYWEPKIKFLKNFVQLLSYNYYAKTIVLRYNRIICDKNLYQLS